MSKHLFSAVLLGAVALLGDELYLAPEQRVEIW